MYRERCRLEFGREEIESLSTILIEALRVRLRPCMFMELLKRRLSG
jgi:hypothetical protein